MDGSRSSPPPVVGDAAPPPRRELAGLLWRLADLVQAAERRRSFRAKAYRRAVWSLDDLPPDLDVGRDDLLATPGIGPGVASLIDEYRSTGQISQLIPLEEAYPSDSAALRRLPRMTPAILRQLHLGLGVDDSSDLLAAIESGAIATVRGLGPATAALWEQIMMLSPGPEFAPAHRAWAEAQAFRSHLSTRLDCRVEVAGSIRRVEEWVDRIVLVAVTPERDTPVAFLTTSAVFAEMQARAGDTWSGTTHSGLIVTVECTPPEAAGTVLLWATGPSQHAASVTHQSFPTELDAYRSADLPLIPPPARGLPIETAATVVAVEEVKGDLHLHTDSSPDGRMSLETVLRTAVEMGYIYVLITDHTLGLRFGGLGGDDVVAQAAAIDAMRPGFPELTVFHGAELNIGLDGSLDLDDDALQVLDFAVAGVHSHFQLDRDTQTARVIQALQHPKVKVLAHPFGRRIGIRRALAVDMDAVIDVAIGNGVALESNGHRDRLDLPADWIGRAAVRGALFTADSDAHRVEEMPNVANAVATLQRAGVTASQVVNTFALDEFTEWARGH